MLEDNNAMCIGYEGILVATDRGCLDRATFSPFVEKTEQEPLVTEPFVHEIFDKPVEVVFSKKHMGIKVIR